MAPAVLFTVEVEEYPEGVFVPWDEWKKKELNESRLNEEIRLLREELGKFSKISGTGTVGGLK